MSRSMATQGAAETALRVYVERGGSPIVALEWANRWIADADSWDRALHEIVGAAVRNAPERGPSLLSAIGDSDLTATFQRRRP